MLPYPQIDPVALAIGPLKIHWYGLMYLIGIGAAWLILSRRLHRFDPTWTKEKLSDLVFWVAMGVIVGGRLGYVLFYDLSAYIANPLLIFEVWKGGMAFHGGLIGVMLATWWFGKRNGKSFFQILDFIAPVVPIGLGAGRIGNFINAELWGKASDVPLISVETLQNLRDAKPQGGIGLLTVKLDDPTGYGRITRENGKVTGIVEHKDATDEQRQIQEINTGILIANGADMKRWLAKLTNNNAQGEYYITDIIALAYQEGREIVAVHPQRLSEVEGVNNRLQLSRLERVYQSEQAEKLLLAGVMLRDPARFDLRGTLTHGRDVEIDTNVIIEGNVTLGHRVKIGTGCVIKNSVIGDDCEISPYTVVEDANLAAACTIGPFARLRPGAELLEGAHVGNFVEMKKARLGKGSKAGHLTYLGDAEIGDNVNIGAGTITCNYDGANKFKTIIGDDVFVGSDTQLVAPVTVGKGATIAAGTTVTRNVGENALAISRVPQTQKEGWRRPVKKK